MTWVPHLIRDRLDDSGQKVVLPLTMLHPWREVPHFAIITVVRKPHFGTDQQDLFVVNDHPAVVNHVLVYDWPNRFLLV